MARNWVADLLLRKNWWLPLKPLQHKEMVNSAAFSPDGRRVVTASGDHTAQVWEADTGKPVGATLQHTNAVNSAAFSADGRRVVTASGDHTAQVWDVLLDSGSPQHTSFLADVAEAVGGYRINELASLVPFSPEEWTQRLDRLRQLAAKAPNARVTAPPHSPRLRFSRAFGKTQTAVEYAYRYRENYAAIF